MPLKPLKVKLIAIWHTVGKLSLPWAGDSEDWIHCYAYTQLALCWQATLTESESVIRVVSCQLPIAFNAKLTFSQLSSASYAYLERVKLDFNPISSCESSPILLGFNII